MRVGVMRDLICDVIT